MHGLIVNGLEADGNKAANKQEEIPFKLTERVGSLRVFSPEDGIET